MQEKVYNRNLRIFIKQNINNFFESKENNVILYRDKLYGWQGSASCQ